MNNYEPCELCGKPATERHHCLVGRKRGQAWRDHPYNLESLCHKCHAGGIVNSYEHRRLFFAKQLGRYGDDFRKWWDALTMKVKPIYD